MMQKFKLGHLMPKMLLKPNSYVKFFLIWIFVSVAFKNTTILDCLISLKYSKLNIHVLKAGLKVPHKLCRAVNQNHHNLTS